MVLKLDKFPAAWISCEMLDGKNGIKRKRGEVSRVFLDTAFKIARDEKSEANSSGIVAISLVNQTRIREDS